MRMQRFRCGFTTIELVLVIVILAILGAIAAPRFFDNRAFSERGWFDEIGAAIRYAQKVAVASGCRVRVDLGVTSYALYQQLPAGGHCDPADNSYPLTVQLADGTAMAGTAPSGITLATPLSFSYTPLGGTTLGADVTLTIGSWSLVVNAQSGLVLTP